MTTLAQVSAKQAAGWVCGLHRGGRSEGHRGLRGVNYRHLYLSQTSSLLSLLPLSGGAMAQGLSREATNKTKFIVIVCLIEKKTICHPHAEM